MVVVVGTVRVAWSKVKKKLKLNDLAMYAIVEVEKQKWETGEDGSGSSQGRFLILFGSWALVFGLEFSEQHK